MKKEEILKELAEMYKLITDKKETAKKYHIEEENVYPFLVGYVGNNIKYILESCNMLEEGKKNDNK